MLGGDRGGCREGSDYCGNLTVQLEALIIQVDEEGAETVVPVGATLKEKERKK